MAKLKVCAQACYQTFAVLCNTTVIFSASYATGRLLHGNQLFLLHLLLGESPATQDRGARTEKRGGFQPVCCDGAVG